MKTHEILLLILGMAIVTYIPRVLPAFLIERIALGPRAKKFLSLLPYAAMSALIFPGVFTVDAAYPLFGVVGGVVAVLLALKKCPLIVCVLGSVGSNCILYMII